MKTYQKKLLKTLIDNEDYEAALKILETEVSPKPSLGERIKNVWDTHRMKRLESELRSEKRKYAQLKQEYDYLRNEYSRLENKIEKEIKAKTKKKINSLKRKTNSLEDRIKELEKEIKDVKRKKALRMYSSYINTKNLREAFSEILEAAEDHPRAIASIIGAVLGTLGGALIPFSYPVALSQLKSTFVGGVSGGLSGAYFYWGDFREYNPLHSFAWYALTWIIGSITSVAFFGNLGYQITDWFVGENAKIGAHISMLGYGFASLTTFIYRLRD